MAYGRREVNVVWFRVYMPLVVVGLFVALATYDRPVPLRSEVHGPFDPQAIKDRLIAGDPITTPEWIGEVNYWSGVFYFFALAGPEGRARLRRIAIVFRIVAAAGAIAVAALVYLGLTRPASFSLTSGEMGSIFLCHALAFAGLATAWRQVRRAAL